MRSFQRGGGSKRIDKKNIREFCGRPIISWTIDRLWKCGLYDGVFVSTDCDEIAEIALRSGAAVPFKREARYATDHAGTLETVVNAVEELEKIGMGDRNVTCVYATSVFVEGNVLREALRRVEEEPRFFICAAAEYDHPIQRRFRIDKEGNATFDRDCEELVRTQDADVYYHDTGLFYTAQAEKWKHAKSILGESKPLVVGRDSFCDIDNEDDWLRAERAFAQHLYERAKTR